MVNQQQLLRMIESVPPFPESVHKVLIMTASSDCSPKALVKVIEHDPILTAEVLRLVNSAYFGLSRNVTSINHAVVYVGINTIKNVAIALATKGALPAKNKAGLDMRQFWEHSLMVGVLAKLLAGSREQGAEEEANYFVAGLLHDIGKILFGHFIPEQYLQISSYMAEHNADELVAENAVLGVDHCQVGALLAEKWKLPEVLVSSIRYHHDVDSAPAHSPVLYATAAANLAAHFVAREAKEFDSHKSDSIAMVSKGFGVEMSEKLHSWLGCDLESAVLGISGLSDELQKAKAFIDVV